KALSEDPGYGPALEAGGRLYHKLGMKERLLEMHRLEAKAALNPTERAVALRRAGEILVEMPETLEEGLANLREAVGLLPGNLTAFSALERTLFRHGRWQALASLYEEELERTEESSRRAWLLSQLGSVAADRVGDRERAIEAFRQASA